VTRLQIELLLRLLLHQLVETTTVPPLTGGEVGDAMRAAGAPCNGYLCIAPRSRNRRALEDRHAGSTPLEGSTTWP
jgi:hypothetical protein